MVDLYRCEVAFGVSGWRYVNVELSMRTNRPIYTTSRAFDFFRLIVGFALSRSHTEHAKSDGRRKSYTNRQHLYFHNTYPSFPDLG